MIQSMINALATSQNAVEAFALAKVKQLSGLLASNEGRAAPEVLDRLSTRVEDISRSGFSKREDIRMWAVSLMMLRRHQRASEKRMLVLNMVLNHVQTSKELDSEQLMRTFF